MRPASEPGPRHAGEGIAGPASASSRGVTLRDWCRGLVGSQPLRGLLLPAAIAGLTLLGVAPVLLAALAFGEPSAGFWAIFIANLVLLFALALVTFGRPVAFAGMLILWFAVQRIVVAIVAPEVDGDTVRLLITYKEGFYIILVAAGVAWLGARYLAGERSLTPLFLCDALGLAMLAAIGFAFLVSDTDTSDRLTYARRLAAPLLLYAGGRLLFTDYAELRDGLRVVLAVALGVAGFGLVERFALEHEFWSDGVDAMGFYGKLVEGGALPEDWVRPYNGLPEGIFSAFPLDVPVRRLVSTFLEPTTLAGFLAFVVLIALFVPDVLPARRGWLAGAAAVVLAVAVAATVGRGGMQTVLIGGGLFLAVSLAWKWRPSRAQAASATLVAAVLLPSLMVASLSFSNLPNRRENLQDVLSQPFVSGFPAYEVPEPDPDAPIDPGVTRHVNGLTSGLNAMLDNPLGLGLGAAGGWSEAPDVGGESATGTVAAQLGMAGLALWLAFHIALVGALGYGAFRRRDERPLAALLLVLACAVFALQVTALFSESASGLLGSALYFLFAGWGLTVAFRTEGPQFEWLPWAAARPADGQASVDAPSGR